MGPTNRHLPPLRMHDCGTNTDVIVADGKTYADLDGDGRIARTDEVLHARRSAFAEGARYIGAYFDTRVPGIRIKDDSIISNGALNAREEREFGRSPGTAARRNPVFDHLAFFDRGNSGVISLRQNYASWRSLRFDALKALQLTLGSALVFGGGPRNGFSIDIADITNRRPAGATRIYDKIGNIDNARLAELSEALGAVAVDGRILQADARSILGEWVTLGRIPQRQFASFFAVAEQMNGSRTITVDQLRWLYDGSLLWRAASMTDARGSRALHEQQ